MKFSSLKTPALLVFVCLTIMGCQDQSSPNGVIGSAYTQLNDGNLQSFQQDLSGTALAMYGSEQGMASLKAKIAGQQFSLSASQVVGHSHDPYGEPTTIYQISTEPALLNFTVVCAEVVVSGCNLPVPGQPSGQNGNCLPVVGNHCTISEILTDSQLTAASLPAGHAVVLVKGFQ